MRVGRQVRCQSCSVATFFTIIRVSPGARDRSWFEVQTFRRQFLATGRAGPLRTRTRRSRSTLRALGPADTAAAHRRHRRVGAAQTGGARPLRGGPRTRALFRWLNRQPLLRGIPRNRLINNL
jgi:hypothetical protein